MSTGGAKDDSVDGTKEDSIDSVFVRKRSFDSDGETASTTEEGFETTIMGRFMTSFGNADFFRRKKNNAETENEEAVGISGSSDMDGSSVEGTPPPRATYLSSIFSSGEKCEVDPESGQWYCRPYKREILERAIHNANTEGSTRYNSIVDTLKSLGVKVFIVDGEKATTSTAILKDIQQVVEHVSSHNRQRACFNTRIYQHCLLFKNREGQLFNLLIAPHAAGPSGQWSDLLDTFSGTEAMIALTVLCRSFPCAAADLIGQFRPAYLSLILGLVFSEEISLSWLNAAMLVRSMPSVATYTINSRVGSDWLRKIMVFSLAIAGAATGATQRALTTGGIALACAILLANLGSRAWHFLRWRPIGYYGPCQQFVAYLGAIATGIVLPYMGHREVEVGGKAAMESVLRSAIIVAIVFLISDYDEVQRLIVVGSEKCNQDYVNLAVGAWWGLTLLFSIFLVRRVKYVHSWPRDEEKLLVPDQNSPVGYKVPSLPDFDIDPITAQQGLPCFSLNMEVLFGVLLAIGVGGGIAYLAFTTWDEELAEELDGSVQDLF